MTTFSPKIHLNPNLEGLGISATVAINDKSNRLRAEGKKIFKLGLGESPFPVPAIVVETLKAAAHEKRCLITGNEDGKKHCGMGILYALQHLGYVIPPQADAGWIGEAGPGPSYLDPGSGEPENDFTNRNTTFMTWNLMHLARMIKDNGGIPAHGNQRSKWEAGCRFDHPNPEYR